MFWHRPQGWLMWKCCPWFFNIANKKNSNEDRGEIADIFTFKKYPLREESSFWIYFTWIFECTVSCWVIGFIQIIIIGMRYSLELQTRRLWLFILLLLFCCWLNLPCSDPAPPNSWLMTSSCLPQKLWKTVCAGLLWSQKSTRAKIIWEITMRRSWQGFVWIIIYL